MRKTTIHFVSRELIEDIIASSYGDSRTRCKARLLGGLVYAGMRCAVVPCLAALPCLSRRCAEAFAREPQKGWDQDGHGGPMRA